MDVNAVAAQTPTRDAPPALGDELSQFGADGGFAALLAQSAQQMSQNGLQTISAKTLSLFKTMQPASPPPAPPTSAPVAAQSSNSANPSPAAPAAPTQDPSAATANSPPPAPTSNNASQATNPNNNSTDQSNSDDQQTSAEASADASASTPVVANSNAGQSNKVSQTQTGRNAKNDKDAKQESSKAASATDPALSQAILAAAPIAAPVVVANSPIQSQTGATPDAGQAAGQTAKGDNRVQPQDSKDAGADQNAQTAAAAAADLAAANAAAAASAATAAAAAAAAASANSDTPAANAAPQIIQLAATAASPSLLGAASAMAGQNNANDAAPSDPIAALLAKRAKPAEKSAIPDHQSAVNRASSQTVLNSAAIASPSLAADATLHPENPAPTSGTGNQTVNSSQAQNLAQIAGLNNATITVASNAPAPSTGVAPQSAASLVPLAILADAALQAGLQQDSQSFGGFGNNSAQQGNVQTPAGADKPIAMAGLQISGDPTLAAAPMAQTVTNPAPITSSENSPTEAISQVAATVASSEAPPTAPLTNSVPTPVMASPGSLSNAAPGSASSQTAASGNTSPSVPAPPAEQLKVQIEKGLKAGSDTISVQLRPDDLGRVDVKLEVQNGQVKATVTADRPETLQLLKNDAGGLQQALQDAGLSADANALSFQLRGEQQQQQQRQASQNRQGNRAVQAVDLALDDSLVPSGMPMQRARSSGAASGVDINV